MVLSRVNGVLGAVNYLFRSETKRYAKKEEAQRIASASEKAQKRSEQDNEDVRKVA